MCRIWGVSYGPEGPEGEAWTPTEFAQILFPALTRGGPHAYGWMDWSGGTDVGVVKATGRADSPKAIRSMDIPAESKWVVAHTRWATHGSPEYLGNNHPIRHGDIIGVHNGVLANHERILEQTGREDPKAVVDSEAIFAAVNAWGVRPGLLKVQGNMVAVMVDLRHPDTIVLAKSYGRPLVLATTDAGSLLWASELQALEALGIPLHNVEELGQYSLLRVKEGKVIQRTTYRTDTWRNYEPKAPVVREKTAKERKAQSDKKGVRIRQETGRGPMHGLTDEFERMRAEGKLNQNGSSPPTKRQKRKGSSPKTQGEPVVKAKKPGDLSNKGVARIMGWRDGDMVGQPEGAPLRYYNGVLLTETEYIDAIRDEVGYEA